MSRVTTSRVLILTAAGVFLGNKVFSDSGRPRVTGTVIVATDDMWFPLADERSSAVSAIPGTLVVDAKVRYTSPRGAQPHYFVLQVLNTATKDLVARIEYDHQAFVIPHKGTVMPTFHEELPVPPGRYCVSLTLRSTAEILDRAGQVVDHGTDVLGRTFYETVR